MKAEIPEFHIKIVGKNPSDKLKELQRQNSESVTITGFVEDLEIEIANSKAMIVPLLFGTGVKLKTLDAFRCSTLL
ncbi:glycosyltransferase family 4 protein [Bacillus megaterium NBRC 15308 = ATCC 14581]|nr:glycosyltransferase family 4 protein [Priestia megaterium NBRC 15308 = ATCC 14581]